MNTVNTTKYKPTAITANYLNDSKLTKHAEFARRAVNLTNTLNIGIYEKGSVPLMSKDIITKAENYMLSNWNPMNWGKRNAFSDVVDAFRKQILEFFWQDPIVASALEKPINEQKKYLNATNVELSLYSEFKKKIRENVQIVQDSYNTRLERIFNFVQKTNDFDLTNVENKVTVQKTIQQIKKCKSVAALAALIDSNLPKYIEKKGISEPSSEDLKELSHREQARRLQQVIEQKEAPSDNHSASARFFSVLSMLEEKAKNQPLTLEICVKEDYFEHAKRFEQNKKLHEEESNKQEKYDDFDKKLIDDGFVFIQDKKTNIQEFDGVEQKSTEQMLKDMGTFTVIGNNPKGKRIQKTTDNLTKTTQPTPRKVETGATSSVKSLASKFQGEKTS